jgi:EAL domain-containing protein (putative c-di-GMP-specific phosphodiesterase class I)
VVGEGVDRPDQMECLRTLGCDFLQGHLMAPALPAAGIPKYLSALTAPVARHSRR